MAQIQSKPLTPRGQYWLKHVQQWQVSGTTQIQYCKDLGLSLHSFRWWRRRLSHVAQDPAKPTPFTEIPVRMLGEPASSYVYEVTLPNRKQLRLQEHFDPDAVASLLLLLERPC